MLFNDASEDKNVRALRWPATTALACSTSGCQSHQLPQTGNCNPIAALACFRGAG